MTTLFSEANEVMEEKLDFISTVIRISGVKLYLKELMELLVPDSCQSKEVNGRGR